MWEKRAMGLNGSKNLGFFLFHLTRGGLWHGHSWLRREPASGSRFIPEKGTASARCHRERGRFLPARWLRHFHSLARCTPMKLSREGELPGVPGEEGLTGWLFLCRNNLRPRMTLSPSRENCSLLPRNACWQCPCGHVHSRKPRAPARWHEVELQSHGGWAEFSFSFAL